MNSTSPILNVFPSVTFSSFLNRDACKFMPCKEKGRGTAEGEICCYEEAQDFRSHTNSIRVLTLPISAFITVVSKRNETLPVRTLHCTKGSAITVQSVVIEKLFALCFLLGNYPKESKQHTEHGESLKSRNCLLLLFR